MYVNSNIVRKYIKNLFVVLQIQEFFIASYLSHVCNPVCREGFGKSIFSVDIFCLLQYVYLSEKQTRKLSTTYSGKCEFIKNKKREFSINTVRAIHNCNSQITSKQRDLNKLHSSFCITNLQVQIDVFIPCS